MANFIGSVQEFHHFIGPRIRNRINTAAARYRRSQGGICQICSEHAELQSAHIHGRERRALIERVLEEYKREDGSVMCDLSVVEQRIIEVHMPINETFKFICHPCHVDYDAGTTRVAQQNGVRGVPLALLDGQFRKIGRVCLWANRPMQAPHQIIRGFLYLAASGEVELSNFKHHCEEKLRISGFAGKYASMKTDAGNSYGKVFFDDGLSVQMWPEVKREVDNYFSEDSFPAAGASHQKVTSSNGRATA